MILVDKILTTLVELSHRIFDKYTSIYALFSIEKIDYFGAQVISVL